MYNGKIERHRREKKNIMNIRELILWYVGILISLVPVLIDVLAYLGNHDALGHDYWVTMCLRGDLLWVLATIIVVTLIDYISDTEAKRDTLRLVCAVIAALMWGLAFAMWIVFKYIYPSDYSRDIPIVLTVVVAIITLLCCSPLQVKEVEK